MKNLDQVTDLGGGRSHWVGRSPLGLKVEWDAEILEEREGQLLSWRSLPGSEVDNAGTVFFDEAPGGRGTVVRVSLEFRGTGIGQAVGHMKVRFRNASGDIEWTPAAIHVDSKLTINHTIFGDHFEYLKSLTREAGQAGHAGQGERERDELDDGKGQERIN